MAEPNLQELLALVVGTADPLQTHQTALAAALARAGVAHENVVLEGLPHGFAQWEFLPPTRETIARMAEFLDTHLA